MRRVSVLITTYDRPGDLLELLESIRAQDDASLLLEEILILDNASTVGYEEVERFVALNPELAITYTRSDMNLGPAVGRNRLITRSKGEILLLLDDDVVFPGAGDLRHLSSLFDVDPFCDGNAGIIQPRIAYYDTKELQRSAFPQRNSRNQGDTSRFLTSFYAGCVHLVRREALEKAGSYPENFFIYMEEYDLAYRVIDAGFSIGYDGAITVEHKESPFGRSTSDVKIRRAWVNKSRVAWRYLPTRYFVSTAILWSFNYLRRVRGGPREYFRGWADVARIPFTERRAPLSSQARAYLKSVNARLWW